MMPPICAFCDKDFRNESSSGNLVQFADYKPLPDGMVGHPHGLAWFCQEHVAAAKSLQHLSYSEAMQELQKQFNR
jgi:hypothetical protein